MKGTLPKRNRVNEQILKSASRHFTGLRCLNIRYRPPRGRHYAHSYVRAAPLVFASCDDGVFAALEGVVACQRLFKLHLHV